MIRTLIKQIIINHAINNAYDKIFFNFSNANTKTRALIKEIFHISFEIDMVQQMIQNQIDYDILNRMQKMSTK